VKNTWTRALVYHPHVHCLIPAEELSPDRRYWAEFMRRFLQHVLPRGFHKVRYYGLLSPRNRQRLDQIRRELTINTQTSEMETSCLNDISSNQSGHQPFLLCPFCQKGYLIPIMVLSRRWRGPPLFLWYLSILTICNRNYPIQRNVQ
jgi:formamidopyrimidine-DNA glycosylase